MLPTIFSFVEVPNVARDEEAPAAHVSTEISRPQLVRESMFRGAASMSGASNFGDEDVEYENGEPTFKGNRVFRCFKNRGNGLLFRIVNDDEHKWAFYNDLNDYTVTVSCLLGAGSHVRALGKTALHVNASTGEQTLVVTVGPRETEIFIDGVPRGFKLSYEARPIPRAECLARHIKITDAQSISINQLGTSDEDSQTRESAQKSTTK